MLEVQAGPTHDHAYAFKIQFNLEPIVLNSGTSRKKRTNRCPLLLRGAASGASVVEKSRADRAARREAGVGRLLGGWVTPPLIQYARRSL